MPCPPPSCVIDPDYELVLRAQSGDTRAFDHLILKHADRLYGLAYRMTTHQEDAHDLVQDVLTKAYRSLSGFRGDASFHTWICRIAVRHTRRFLAHRRRTAGPSLQELLQSGHAEPAELEARRMRPIPSASSGCMNCNASSAARWTACRMRTARW